MAHQVSRSLGHSNHAPLHTTTIYWGLCNRFIFLLYTSAPLPQVRIWGVQNIYSWASCFVVHRRRPSRVTTRLSLLETEELARLCRKYAIPEPNRDLFSKWDIVYTKGVQSAAVSVPGALNSSNQLAVTQRELLFVLTALEVILPSNTSRDLLLLTDMLYGSSFLLNGFLRGGSVVWGVRQTHGPHRFDRF